MSPLDPITTSVAHRDGVAVVTVGGEIDLRTLDALKSAIAEALRDDATALVIDLSAVTFMSSGGLQVLVATHEKVGESARFAIVANGPATSRPIPLTGLDEIFELYPTMDDALTAVHAPSE